jgi:hypothetical protein
LDITWLGPNIEAAFDSEGYGDGLILVHGFSKGNGYMNRAGEMVIPYGYLRGRRFSEGLAAITTEKMETPPAYQGELYIYHYIDTKGNTVFPDGSISDESFHNGLAKVADQSGKASFINKDGELIFPFLYDDLDYPSDGRVLYKLGNLFGYLDLNGNVLIEAQYPFAEGYSEGTAAVRDEAGKMGYIDLNGQEVIAPIYETAGKFIDGAAPVSNEEKGYGLIDRSGELVIPMKFRYVGECGDGMTAVQSFDEKWAFFTSSGKKVTAFQYDIVRDYVNGIAVVKLPNTHYGAIDRHGNIVVPFVFSGLTDFQEGLAVGSGYVSGEDVLTGIIQYPAAANSGSQSRHYIAVIIDGKEAISDQEPVIENGRILIPIRMIVEQLAADVDWLPKTRSAVIRYNNTEIQLSIGEKEAFVNGHPYDLDVPARIVGGRTMIPLRFLMEQFDLDIRWDEQARTVFIGS